MDEVTVNRIANQLGVALINVTILQSENERLQAEIARLQAKADADHIELVDLRKQVTAFNNKTVPA